MKKQQVSLSDYDEISHIDEVLTKFNWSKYSNKRILVTGSNGMLGLCLTKLLIRAYEKNFLNFQSLSLASRNWSDSKQQKITNEKINYIDNDYLLKEQDKYDVVFHLASPSNISKIESLEETLRINTLAGFNFEKVSHLIYISSGEIYLGGDTTKEPEIQDFTLGNPRGIYPYSKFKAEEYFTEIAQNSSMELTVLRLFHTFGPGLDPADGRSFADFIWQATSKENITLLTSGEQVRSFLYILDAAFGIIQASLHESLRKVFNLGSADQVSIFDFAQVIANHANVKVEINYKQTILPLSPFDHVVPSIEKLKGIGWAPKYDLNFAIEKTLKWAQAISRS